MRRLRILVVTHVFPLPVDRGGAVRALLHVSALASKHDVILVARSRPEVSEADEVRMTNILGSHGRLLLVAPSEQIGTLVSSRRWVRGMLWGAPTAAVSQYDPVVAKEVERESRSCDVVVILDEFAGLHLRSVPSHIPRVLDKSNVMGFSTKLEPLTRTSWLRPIGDWLVRRFESWTGNGAFVIVTSPEESNRYQQLYGRPADAVLPSAVHPGPQRPPVDSRKIGWLGLLRYAPNADGLQRFADEAWQPSLRGAVLEVVGRTVDSVFDPRGASDIEMLGYVADLDAWMSTLALAVVPLWSGAGVKLKTLSFMSAGVPVVGTAIAFEGIPVLDGVHGLIRDDPKEMRRVIEDLLANPRLAQSIGEAGRRLVEDHFNARKISSEFLSLVEGAARPAT